MQEGGISAVFTGTCWEFYYKDLKHRGGGEEGSYTLQFSVPSAPCSEQKVKKPFWHLLLTPNMCSSTVQAFQHPLASLWGRPEESPGNFPECWVSVSAG